jgi:DNA gyrase subunit B
MRREIKKGEYTAKDIQILSGLEPVRKRPAMYIGSTGIEGVHHLLKEIVFNSVTYQTPVIIREKGKIKLKKIGEMIDGIFRKNKNLLERSIDGETEILRENLEIEALSFDPASLKLNYRPISALIRHKVNSEIFRITLQNNRKIEITPYHSLFTLKEGRVIPIEGKEIKINTPIIVPRNWPEPESPLKKIDLIEELLKLPKKKTAKIKLYGLSHFLKSNEIIAEKIKQSIPRFRKTKSQTKRKKEGIWRDYLRFDYLPFNLIRNLSKEEIEEIKKFAFLGNKRRNLPSQLTISRWLVELLGLFAAEGTIITDKRGFSHLVFSFGVEEKELRDYVSKLIEKIFGIKPTSYYAHESAEVLYVGSYLVSLIFKEIFKTGENCSNKRVPDLIFNLSRDLRERYLIAYLAGDGYPTEFWTKHLISSTSPNEIEKRKFTSVTKNLDLAVGFVYLLSSLSKSYSFGERKIKRTKRIIKLNYKGKEKIWKIKERGYSFAIDFYWKTNSSYINYLPSKEIISQIFWGWPHQFSLNFYGNGGVSRDKVLTLFSKQKLVLHQGAIEFINSDLGILRVKKIEKIKYKKPYVYDISVPNGENFIAGFSPIVAHNSIDEAIMGYCDEIKVSLLPKNRAKVEDNGRGIPVDIHPQTKKPALETIITTLHAGGKFGGKAYVCTGGLHGVGISAVCALSKYMKVQVFRDGFEYYQEYSKGKPTTKLIKAGKSKKTGTIVIFEPDPEIFREIRFEREKILTFLKQQSFLNKKLKIFFFDQRTKPYENYCFYFEGGIISYLKYLISDQERIMRNIFYCSGKKNEILVEAAFCYTDEYESYEEAFANNVFNPQGGTHLTGFRSALTRTFNEFAKKNGLLKENDENLTGDDIREGLTAVVSVKIKEPQFEGQTKAKLGNPEAKIAVESIVSEAILDFFEKNPSDARAVIQKCILAQKARKAAKTARETVLRKGILEGLTLPGKLADCTTKNPENAELFIVEGESAGGSSRQARDRHFQAILPLRGKILNVERARLDKILSSKEIRSLIIAIGTAIAEDFDIEKARYHKIIITCDADVDGNHIKTLLLTLFYRYFKPMIEKGYLYIAQPPLYKIQSGKEIKYAYSDEEKLKILKSFKKTTGINIQRYKGLGEMNASELWETTMNPQKRVLKKVRIEDAKEADRIFDILMGKEVLPRKRFIYNFAKKVKNLDI